MFGLLLGPLHDFLFDDPGIDAVAAWFQNFLLHFPEEVFVPVVEGLGSLRGALRQTAFQNLKATRE